MGNAQASRSRGRGRPPRGGAEDDDPYSPPGANVDPYANSAVNDPLADDQIHRQRQQQGHKKAPPAQTNDPRDREHRSSAHQHHQQRTDRHRGSHSRQQQQQQHHGSAPPRKHGSGAPGGDGRGSHIRSSGGRSSAAAAAAPPASSTPAPIPPPPAPVGGRKSAPAPATSSKAGGAAPRKSATSGGGERASRHHQPPSTAQPQQPTGASTSRQSRKSAATASSASSPSRQSNKSSSRSGPAPEDAAMFSRREKMKKEQFQSAASMKASDIPQPDSSSGMSFDELYRLKEVLGTGAFSTVREGYHRRHRDRMFAVKCVNRAKLTEEDAAALLDEVAILKELRHAHIIRLYDFFEEPGNYYLVMEKMTGGELFDRIVAKAYYNEKEARDTCKIILEAVGYCHKHKVAHRDLKPENLLLVSESSDSSVKIADFGFAKKVLAPKTLTTQCGTPGYVAPEILEGVPYDTKSDMWSVGVILYILLGGYPPFIENNQRELFRKIRRGDYEFHEEYWGAVSTDAKTLISSLLTVNPAKRLDAREALANKWICEDDDKLEGNDLGVNLDQLKKFNAKRKFKAAVSTVMAVNKLQSLGKDFLKNLE